MDGCIRPAVQRLLPSRKQSVTKSPPLPFQRQKQSRKAKKGDGSAVYFGVWIVFNLPRPKYHFVANDPQRKLKAHFSGNRFVNKRPDVDNLIKFILDALNGLAYKDDAAVVEIHSIKKWDNDPKNEGSTSILVKSFDTNEMVG